MSTVEAFTTPEPAELAVPQRRRMSGLRGLPLPVKIGGAILVLMALLALLAPVIAPYGPNELDFENLLSGPSSQHLFGTDQNGRDVFSRTLYALRVDLAIVVFVTYVPLPIGVVVGALAGYLGGRTDAILSRITDTMI